MKIINYFRNLPNGVKIILTINIVIYVLCLLLDTISYSLISKLAIYATNNPNFEAYQFITNMFTHNLAFDHIFFNMLFFMIFAVNLENKIGTKNIILLYVVGGIISSIVCDFVLREKYLNFILEYQNLKPQTHIDVIAYKIRLDDNINYNNSYGASGSVCGVMIAYFAFNVLAWKKILFNLFILFFTYKTIILLSFDSTGTHSNHLGGMIGGGIVALILLVIKNKNGVKINLTPNSLLVKN